MHCRRIFVAGFSTGGALALKLAAEQHHEIIGVIAVSVPLKFVNSAFMLVHYCTEPINCRLGFCL